MQINKKDIELLWNKLLQNKASQAELDILFQYVNDKDIHSPDWNFIQEGIAGEQPENVDYIAMDNEQRADLRRRLLEITTVARPTITTTDMNVDAFTAMDTNATTLPRTTIRPQFRRSWLIAASILLVMGYSIYLFQNPHSNKSTPPPETIVQENDIEPGKAGAILTLGDGRKLILDSVTNGLIASQNGAQAVVKNGQLVYDIAGHATGEVVYNTVTTPKGRKFNMLLPDGTEVWLNAASSIRYPTVFTGWERAVNITGEVFFNVAKNKTTPFRVNVDQRETIHVLGTSFNVNAYVNEFEIQTTLLDGSIRVEAGTAPQAISMVVLKPGQQARLLHPGSGSVNSATAVINVKDDVALDKVIAWKNDYFNLDDIPLSELMRQVERWYDVAVIFENGVPDKRFFGKVNRGISLLDFMEGLKDWGVTFKLENNTLIITK